MMRNTILTAALFLMASASVFGAGLGVGSEVPEFELKSVEGADVAYSDISGDVTVVAFIATKCPISNDYNERMNAIYGDYARKGVKFVFINSNKAEDAAEVKAHAAENGFKFSVYKDPGNVVADRFGAEVTPEIFLVKGGKVVYHGRIDDARTGEIKHHSLREALDAVLDGKTPDPAEARAFGCTIKRVS